MRENICEIFYLAFGVENVGVISTLLALCSVLCVHGNSFDLNTKVVTSLENPLAIHFNQGFIVTGVVKDEKGAPLPGASIIEKGTQNAAVTDFEGNFTINVQDETAVLSVS